jgi:Xaa-Pro aminopeptidase
MLVEIKNFLKKNKINFLLLPNSDEFFSEYLPESKQLIKAITSFTGSNAIVIFGLKKSFFFTDSRYILQAKNQLDKEEYEILDIAKTPVIYWLQSNLTNKKIALFSKLTSVNFVSKIEKFAVNNIEFFDEIFIDKISINQAISKQSPIFYCHEKISGKSDIEKRKIIAKEISGDALLITKSDELCWLLNIRSSDVKYSPLLLAYAILFKDGKVDLFIDEKRLNGLTLENVNCIAQDNLDLRLSFLRKKIKTIDVDFKNLNYFLLKQLQKNDFIINDKNNEIELVKSQKNPREIYGAKLAHNLDGLALTKFILWFKNAIKNQEITEISAQQKLHEFRQENKNFIYESFATISAFASNSAIVHYNADENSCKKITDDSLYLLDSGGQYLGEDFFGTTDVTRTFLVGKASAEMIEKYTLVLKGHIALARVKFPRGLSGSNLDVLARFHLWQVGEDYGHGTGHGVGAFANVHEGPCAISLRNQMQLLPSMILSNEPGYYKEGHFGIRLENLQRVIELDEKFLTFETLTLMPFEADLIDFKMLTYPEKKWLKNYHQRILDELFHKLTFEEQRDLSSLCAGFLSL